MPGASDIRLIQISEIASNTHKLINSTNSYDIISFDSHKNTFRFQAFSEFRYTNLRRLPEIVRFLDT